MFRCRNAGTDDTDHVMVRRLDRSRLAWPGGQQPNPFVRYRDLLYSYHMAWARGMEDAEYVDLVERLDRRVAAVDGLGFAVTPFGRSDELSGRLGFSEAGGVWVKNETGNVSGSHKARHLFGVLLSLAVAEETGLRERGTRDLVVASCGNAALAAAVLARADQRRLRVFVPSWADPMVVDRLRSLGAEVEERERVPGLAGDPTVSALHRAVDAGAVPFTCQGSENGLAIEGGQTLGYEMVSALRGHAPDRVLIQVGGGALASAVIEAYAEGRSLGATDRMPRFHAVQTRGGYPLGRAYERVLERAAAGSIQDALAYASRHRSEFMWPWEQEPRSIATGILDDETYDWLAVVRGMLETEGSPVVVAEQTLERANDLGRRATGIDADHTGTAGLAGLLELVDRGEVDPDERVAVLFTGGRLVEGVR